MRAMSSYECPLLERIFSCCESFQSTSDPIDAITPGKSSFLHSEFPAFRPRPSLCFDRADLACLSGHEWINDQVLNSYISLVASESNANIGHTNSFFFKKLERDGCEAAAPWHGIKNQPLNTYSLFLVPVCWGVHWVLAVFDFVEGQLAILDSLHRELRAIAERLNGFLEWQIGSPLPVVFPEVPEQRNGYDCGVFVMEFARRIFAGEPLDSFSQADIPRMRREIKERLEAAIRP
jgi:Ulp1 family protease